MTVQDILNQYIRECLDVVIKFHGRQLVDFLQDCDMVTLNGRFSQDMDNFTTVMILWYALAHI